MGPLSCSGGDHRISTCELFNMSTLVTLGLDGSRTRQRNHSTFSLFSYKLILFICILFIRILFTCTLMITKNDIILNK